jgi:hypothetical protein
MCRKKGYDFNVFFFMKVCFCVRLGLMYMKQHHGGFKVKMCVCICPRTYPPRLLEEKREK